MVETIAFNQSGCAWVVDAVGHVAPSGASVVVDLADMRVQRGVDLGVLSIPLMPPAPPAPVPFAGTSGG